MNKALGHRKLKFDNLPLFILPLVRKYLITDQNVKREKSHSSQFKHSGVLKEGMQPAVQELTYYAQFKKQVE